jgi:hypothetical protein
MVKRYFSGASAGARLLGDKGQMQGTEGQVRGLSVFMRTGFDLRAVFVNMLGAAAQGAQASRARLRE